MNSLAHSRTLASHQIDLIDALLSTGALAFGDFVLKSGRPSPYFINTGKLSSGSVLNRIGQIYAAHLVAQGLGTTDYLFGPAYKGIPLAVSAATALYALNGHSAKVIFNRKEEKDHGEGGLLIGEEPKPRNTAVIIEDVITAGITVGRTLRFLRATTPLDISAVVVLVDRCEKGAGSLSAIAEVAKDFAIKVLPVITIYDILEYLSLPLSQAHKIPQESARNLSAYLHEYASLNT